jgi:DNA-binding transcriptional LysR family regulator
MVVKYGSFSSAGAELGISQPAVSLQIRQLERQLQVKLIERVAKSMKPTAAGRVLLAHRVHIQAAVDAALNDMAIHTQDVVGEVKLGTGATACIHLIPPMLRKLKQTYPHLNVGVYTGNTDNMIRDVESNRLDIALVTLPATGRNLNIIPLLQDEFVAIFCANTQPLPTQFSAGNLSVFPLVVFESGSNTRNLIDEWFKQSGVNNVPIMELGSIEAIKEMVSAGLGFSIIPRMAATSELVDKGVSCHSLSPVLERTLGLAMRLDKPLSKGLQKVIDSLHKLTNGQGY